MEDTITYCCDHCGYKFKRKGEFTEKVCPYCGQQKTVKREKQAQDWINEVLE